MKLIVLAAGVIVTAGLLAIMTAMFTTTRDVGNSQQKSLEGLNSAYSDGDLTLMDGEVVAPSSALSIARRYFGKIKIYLSGRELTSDDLKKSTFGENGGRLRIEVNRSGDTILGIKFSTIDSSNLDGESAAVVHQTIASWLGLGSSSTWEDIKTKINDDSKNAMYKTKIAAIVGCSEEASWDDVFESLNSFITAASSKSKNSVTMEEISVAASSGGTNGETKFEIVNPSYGIVVDEDSNSEVGLLIFSPNGTVKNRVGTTDGLDVPDGNSSTIVNSSNASYKIVLYTK